MGIIYNIIALLIAILLYKLFRWIGMEEGLAAVMVLFSHFDTKDNRE